MPDIRQIITLGTSEGRSKPVTAARLVNLYAEAAPISSIAPPLREGLSSVRGILFGTPGLKAFVTAGSGDIRCGLEAFGYLYVLSGASLYRIDSLGNATLCTGDTIPATGIAMMTENGLQLTILSNGECFVVETTVVAQINSPGFPAAGVSSIATIDGYTIFTTAAGGVPVFGSPQAITGVTQANPAVVTSTSHGLQNGDQVQISSIVGMTQLNGNTYAVQNVSSDTFELVGVDSTLYSAYSSGGVLQRMQAQSVGQWFISALYDSTLIDPLDFATAESNSDALRRVMVSNRDVLLFGAKTVEPWQNAGASPFPFARVASAIMEKGILAPMSAALGDNSVFWLGDDRIVYRAQGYQPVRISTHAVEEVLRDTADVSDAFGMVYSQAGHTFYVLTLPGAMRTFVYDVAFPFWHERKSGTEQGHAVWAVNCLFNAFDKVFAGCASGKVCELDLDTYTDQGQPIRRIGVSSPLYPDGKLAKMPEIELECELGVGLNTGQGSDPQAMLRISDDGGQSFGNERWASIGATGSRRKRAMWRRNGQFRGPRVLEFTISDPVKVAVYGFRHRTTVDA